MAKVTTSHQFLPEGETKCGPAVHREDKRHRAQSSEGDGLQGNGSTTSRGKRRNKQKKKEDDRETVRKDENTQTKWKV